MLICVNKHSCDIIYFQYPYNYGSYGGMYGGGYGRGYGGYNYDPTSMMAAYGGYPTLINGGYGGYPGCAIFI